MADQEPRDDRDIVSRLRGSALLLSGGHGRPEKFEEYDPWKAAEDIVRLRAALKTFVAAHDDYQASLAPGLELDDPLTDAVVLARAALETSNAQ